MYGAAEGCWDQTPVSLRAKLFFIYPFSIGIIALALAVVISLATVSGRSHAMSCRRAQVGNALKDHNRWHNRRAARAKPRACHLGMET
jgi:hypothetical protein